MRDHPRVCGEHHFRPPSHALQWGSSPRMRGTLQCRPKRHQPTGIIPAYAGNTGISNLLRENCRDHPRVCGEHWPNTTPYLLDKGSSPRMRGTQPSPNRSHDRMGIIPAYAGNTRLPCSHIGWFRDHPRVCGEHWLCLLGVEGKRGSSPRMRGTPHAHAEQGGKFGIIPAYAGNTLNTPDS